MWVVRVMIISTPQPAIDLLYVHGYASDQSIFMSADLAVMLPGVVPVVL